MFNEAATVEVDEKSRSGVKELIDEMFELKVKLDKREVQADDYIQKKQRMIDDQTKTYDPNFEFVSKQQKEKLKRMKEKQYKF